MVVGGWLCSLSICYFVVGIVWRVLRGWYFVFNRRWLIFWLVGCGYYVLRIMCGVVGVMLDVCYIVYCALSI